MKSIILTFHPIPDVVRWLLTAVMNMSQHLHGSGSLSDHSKPMGHASDGQHSREQESAFLRIIDEHQSVIYRICRSYTDTRYDREDLYQEIVYQLWKAFPRFKGKSKVSTWIHTIAVRSAIMPYRRKEKAWIESTDSLPDHPDDQRPIDEGPDDQVFLVFNGLGNFERGVLVLMLEGYQTDEIAKALRMSSDTLYRKMRKVKQSIEND